MNDTKNKIKSSLEGELVPWPISINIPKWTCADTGAELNCGLDTPDACEQMYLVFRHESQQDFSSIFTSSQSNS